jgi:hypothetical protein
MSTLILHAFPQSIGNQLRACGHRIIEVADHDGADHHWRDVVTARDLNPSPLDPDGLALLGDLLHDAATIFDLYARHFQLNQADHSDFRGMLELHVRFALELLKSGRPDALAFSTIPHEGYDFVLFHVARRLGIHCLVCYQTPCPDRFWLMEDGWSFSGLDQTPAVFEWPHGDVLPKVDLFYMRGAGGVPSYTLIDAVKNSLRRPLAMPAFMFRWQRAAIYRHRARACSGRMSADTRPCVYFPLHLQPELTTSVLGGVFADQILAVEYLREILPDEVRIVVKENPRQTEMHRGRLFFERLRRIPKTILVDADTPTTALIDRCEAVATVSGTAGWEGLLAGKPVLLFGRAWYEGFNGVYGVNDIVPKQLPPAPDHPALMQDFSRRLSRAFEGIVDDDYVPIAPGYNALKNAAKVAQVLLSRIDENRCAF